MRVEFVRSNDRIGIPYLAVDRPDGNRNHGYIDLKRNPGRVEEIPELEDVPEFKGLVRELNHPRSIVRSLSVEKALGPNADALFNRKLTSFVRICFEILPWNFDDENYRRLFDMFKDGTERIPNTPELLIIEFEVDPASFQDHNATGWALTIWTNGFGRTDQEARENWGTGLSILQDFFAHQRKTFELELDKGQPTIS